MIFTDRQKQVISGLERGLTKDEIAAELGISRNTVRQHYDALKRKLAVDRVRHVPQAYRDRNGAA